MREIKYSATTVQRWSMSNFSRWAKCKESSNIRLLDSEDCWTTSEICFTRNLFGGFSQFLPWEKSLKQKCYPLALCPSSTLTAERIQFLYKHTPHRGHAQEFRKGCCFWALRSSTEGEEPWYPINKRRKIVFTQNTRCSFIFFRPIKTTTPWS